MNIYTEKFTKKLDELEYTYSCEQTDKGTDQILVDAYLEDNRRDFELIYMIDDDGFAGVYAKCFGNVREDRRTQVLESINCINKKSRVTLYISDNSDIMAYVGYNITEQNADELSLDIANIFIWAIDEMYPQIMEALWK